VTRLAKCGCLLRRDCPCGREGGESRGLGLTQGLFHATRPVVSFFCSILPELFVFSPLFRLYSSFFPLFTSLLSTQFLPSCFFSFNHSYCRTSADITASISTPYFLCPSSFLFSSSSPLTCSPLTPILLIPSLKSRSWMAHFLSRRISKTRSFRFIAETGGPSKPRGCRALAGTQTGPAQNQGTLSMFCCCATSHENVA